MNAIKWILGALVVAALAVVTLMIGNTLMPARAISQGKGTIVPWMVTWGMIWTTAGLALVVALYMVVTGLGKGDA